MDVIAPQSDEVSTVISSEFVVVGGGIAGVSCTVQVRLIWEKDKIS